MTKRASSPTPEEELDWIIAEQTAWLDWATKKKKLPKHLVRKEKPKAKAFANPSSWGYGGGETPWPFSYEKALLDGRYRAGIRNAIKSDWTASNWKYTARRLLDVLLEELAWIEINP